MLLQLLMFLSLLSLCRNFLLFQFSKSTLMTLANQVKLSVSIFLTSDNTIISSEHISFDSVSSSSPIGSIELPSNLLSSLSNNSSSKITRAVFVTDSFFLRRGFSYDRVGSIILSASVVGIGTLRGLRPPVNLGFQLNPVRVMKVEVKLNFILCRMLMGHFQNVLTGTNP